MIALAEKEKKPSCVPCAEGPRTKRLNFCLQVFDEGLQIIRCGHLLGLYVHLIKGILWGLCVQLYYVNCGLESAPSYFANILRLNLTGRYNRERIRIVQIWCARKPASSFLIFQLSARNHSSLLCFLRPPRWYEEKGCSLYIEFLYSRRMWSLQTLKGLFTINQIT